MRRLTLFFLIKVLQSLMHCLLKQNSYNLQNVEVQRVNLLLDKYVLTYQKKFSTSFSP